MDSTVYKKFREELMDSFSYRCALNPSHKAEVLHHIVPRALLKSDERDEDNCIPLCVNCHSLVHIEGTTKYRELFKEKLKRYVKS